MFPFFFLFYLTQSCQNLCNPCTIESVSFVRNQCTQEIYSSYGYQDINCSACVLNSGIQVDCNSVFSAINICEVSPSCTFKIYPYSAESFTSNPLPKSSICSWEVDLSNSAQLNQILSLQFSSSNPGNLIISAFQLPYGIPASSYTAKMVLLINKSNYNSFKQTTLGNINYLTIVYYSLNTDSTYAGFTLTWAQVNGGGDSQLSQILTITALCLVSFFCMGCCGVLCRRLYKSARNSTRVYDQALSNFQGRARVYEVLPDNSVIYEGDIERMFPKEEFKEDLIEVGEKVCCICLEDLTLNSFVRKLPCKHVFHAKCIEDYFLGRNLQPKCPLCKSNPFMGEGNELPHVENVPAV